MHVVILTDLQCWDELAQRDQQEVEVEKEFELLVKDEGEKRYDGVLLIPYDVWREYGSIDLDWHSLDSKCA
jgi:hypothetical protein